MAPRVVTVTPAEVAAARALIRLSGDKLSGEKKVSDKVKEALVRLAEAETRSD